MKGLPFLRHALRHPFLTAQAAARASEGQKERGPVDGRALARLAANWFSEVGLERICFGGRESRRSALVVARPRGLDSGIAGS
jgi:hypothetical protein